MTIEIKNSDVIIRVVKERLQAMKRVLETAVSDEATRIVIRTQGGKDVNGAAFQPYTKAYAKRKAKAGRNTSPVDLTFNGTMLSSIQTRTEDDGNTATIFFSSAREAAKASGNQRLRPFFGLSDEQVKRIKQRLEQAK